MATSGSIDSSLDAREVITFALRKLRVTPLGVTVGATEAATAQQELNLMLKGWQKYPSLWRMTEGTVTLVADIVSYVLAPIPHRVISARYKGTSGNEVPMEDLSRSEYYDLPNKTTAGTPHSYYVDNQRAAVTMYVWQPLASVTTETISYTFQRKFEDIDSLDNDIDVKQEWLEVVGYNLCTRLGPDFGRCDSRSYAKIEQLAAQFLQEMLDDDREDEVRMQPAYVEMGGW